MKSIVGVKWSILERTDFEQACKNEKDNGTMLGSAAKKCSTSPQNENLNMWIWRSKQCNHAAKKNQLQQTRHGWIAPHSTSDSDPVPTQVKSSNCNNVWMTKMISCWDMHFVWLIMSCMILAGSDVTQVSTISMDHKQLSMDALSSLIILGMFSRSVVWSDQVVVVWKLLNDTIVHMPFFCSQRDTFWFLNMHLAKKTLNHLFIGHGCSSFVFCSANFFRCKSWAIHFWQPSFVGSWLLQFQIEFFAPTDSSWADLRFLWEMNSLLHALVVHWSSHKGICAPGSLFSNP